MPRGRPKKIIEMIEVEVPDEVEVTGVSGETAEKSSITLLTQDFGREDINTIRDKINEIIKSLK